MGQEFLDIVLGQDASGTSSGTGMPPVRSCQSRSAASRHDLRLRNQLKGGDSLSDSPWRVLASPPHLCRPLTPACLQPQREDVI